ncbi:hypothetical protein [Streptomyces sp. NPDC057740]|uniref:hypothetical protein n=1 Tax=Streptomyces sp. NPDC057740 TaxID=3346234 RepID=UPI003693C0F7
MALVSRHGLRTAGLAGFDSRLVSEPRDLRTGDDVILFRGSDTARELKRFRAEAEDDLPPAVILAPWLDRDDVSQAPDHGAAGYLLENR